MVKVACKADEPVLIDMLFAMTKELWPDQASNDLDAYKRDINKYLDDPMSTILMDEDDKGFAILRDETEDTVPGRKILNGVKVYIKPEYRKGRVLKEFYDEMFRMFPDYEIWGLTEWHSEHNKVLLKRHEPVAVVYKMKRS